MGPTPQTRDAPLSLLARWRLPRPKLINGIKASLQAFLLAAPAAVVGLACVTLPVSMVACRMAETLLQCKLAEEHASDSAINPLSWTEEHREQMRDELWPFYIFLVIRSLSFSAVGSATLGCAPLLALLPEETGLRLAFQICEGLLFLLTFGVNLTMGLMVLQGGWSVDIIVVEIVNLAANLVFWAPVHICIYTTICRHQRWLQKLGLVVAMMLGSCMLYYGWRGICMLYFRLESGPLKVAVGILVPHLLSAAALESFIHLAAEIHTGRSFTAATILMVSPIAFSVVISTMLQLGSSDWISGICMEVGSCLLEVRHKSCLLSGYTPREMLCSRTRQCFASPLPAQSHAQVFPAPQMDSVFPSVGEDLAGPCRLGTSESQVSQETDAEDERQNRQLLLVRCVAVSNVTELTTHAMVAGLYLGAKINPNMVQAPPLPVGRVLALLMLKCVSEVVTDTFLASLEASSDGDASVSVEDTLRAVSRKERVIIVVFLVMWVMEIQTFYLQFLCPYPDPDEGGTALLSLGLCPDSDWM